MYTIYVLQVTDESKEEVHKHKLLMWKQPDMKYSKEMVYLVNGKKNCAAVRNYIPKLKNRITKLLCQKEALSLGPQKKCLFVVSIYLVKRIGTLLSVHAKSGIGSSFAICDT